MRHRSKLLAALGALMVLLMLMSAVGAAERRLHVIALKLTGKLSEISWTELVPMLGRGPTLNVQTMIETQNPYNAISNPLASPADASIGRELFRANCTLCHGPTARGDRGPDLTGGTLRHGNTDWAIFRTITRGIPGTAMPKHDLPSTSVWRLVAFLREARAEANSERASQADSAARSESAPVINVTFEGLKRAADSSSDWLMYSGAYNGHRHSRLLQIRRENIGRLQLKWVFQLPGTDSEIETSPLVVGSTMFFTSPIGNVWAIDALTGLRKWLYSVDAPADLRICCGPVNRGLAILGTTLFVGTLDAHLLALDARTGAVKWNVTVADHRKGYSITSAPLALGDRILIGVAGGEFGIRGFLDAYAPETGARLWRFNTVPGPGELGHDTWDGDSWRTGGGPTWLTGSYDPELDLVYWGVGNPAPDFQGDVRAGLNLFSNSVVALEASTGKLRWHYQFTPHDEHDWDAVQIPVLADAVFGGIPRKLMYWANRNGFYYVLDRTSGEFLHAAAFVKQTWSAGFDSLGRPLTKPGASPTREGTLVYPGVMGGTNWWSPTYDPATNLFYVPAMETPSLYFTGEAHYTSRGLFLGSVASIAPTQPVWTAVRALDAATGQLRWEHRLPSRDGNTNMGGLLSTNGGLVFGGDQGRFFALDAATGKELWYSQSEGVIHAAPITYLSQGRQLVSIAQGRAILTFSLDGH